MSWDTIIADPEFQALEPERKQKIANNYFAKNFESDKGFISLPEEKRFKIRSNFESTLKLEPSLPSRGLFMDVATAPVRGLVNAAETYGRAARTIDPEGGRDFVRDIGTKVVGLTEKVREKAPYIFKPSKESEKSIIRKAITEGTESFTHSVATGLPGGVVGAVGGIPGMIAGYATSGGALFGLAEYDQFLEEASKAINERKDLTPEEKTALIEKAKPFARKSALVEGGFEFASDLAEGLTMKIGKPFTQLAKGSVRSLLTTTPKQVLLNMAKVTAIETPTEMTQAYLETGLRQKAGIETGLTPAQAGLEVVGPTLFSSVLFGALGSRFDYKQKQKIRNALVNPKMDIAEREDAINAIAPILSKVNKPFAETWTLNALNSVAQRKPIDIDISLGKIEKPKTTGLKLEQPIKAEGPKLEPEPVIKVKGEGLKIEPVIEKPIKKPIVSHEEKILVTGEKPIIPITQEKPKEVIASEETKGQEAQRGLPLVPEQGTSPETKGLPSGETAPVVSRESSKYDDIVNNYRNIGKGLDYEIGKVVIGKKGKVVDIIDFTGEKGKATFPVQQIIDSAIKNKADSVNIIHNHPGGLGKGSPSPEDILSIGNIEKPLRGKVRDIRITTIAHGDKYSTASYVKSYTVGTKGEVTEPQIIPSLELKADMPSAQTVTGLPEKTSPATHTMPSGEVMPGAEHKEALTKEGEYAKGLREDEGRVPAGRDVEEGFTEESRKDLERKTQEEPSGKEALKTEIPATPISPLEAKIKKGIQEGESLTSRKQLAEQMKQTGMSDEEAETNIQLAVDAPAKALGITPDEFIQSYIGQVKKSTMAELEGKDLIYEQSSLSDEGARKISAYYRKQYGEEVKREAEIKERLQRERREDISERQMVKEEGQVVSEPEGISPRLTYKDVYKKDVDRPIWLVFKKNGEEIARVKSHIKDKELLAYYTKAMPEVGADSLTQEEVYLDEEKTYYQSAEQAKEFYSHLEDVIEKSSQARYVPQQLLNYLKAQGVKDAEIEATGLKEYLKEKGSISKDELLEYLRGNQVEIKVIEKETGDFSSMERERFTELLEGKWEDLSIQEQEEFKILAEKEKKNKTKFSQWVEPGGKDYKEILLTLPVKLTRGDITRIRDTAYADYDAGKITKEERNRIVDNVNKDIPYKSSHYDEPNIVAHIRVNDRTDTNGKKVLFVEEIQSDWATDLKRGKASVPQFPFSKTWHELALKHILRYASENGYDSIVWTTGEMQQNRYDLSKQIKSVFYDERGGILKAYDLNGDNVIHKSNIKPEELENYIGKEPAKKLLEQTSPSKEISGLDLKAGGEWAKRLYDEMIPQFLNKYTKKWGGKVGEAEVSPKETGFLSEAGMIETPEGIRYLRKPEIKGMKVQSIDITPSMRQSILQEGQPLFQGNRGAIEFTKDGKAIIHILENADKSTFIHEMFHLYVDIMQRTPKLKAQLKILETWIGKPVDKWTVADNEKVAKGGEKYLWEGNAPTSALKTVFARFKEWLQAVYKTAKGLDVKLSDDVRKMWDEWFGGKKPETETKEVAIIPTKPAKEITPSKTVVEEKEGEEKREEAGKIFFQEAHKEDFIKNVVDKFSGWNEEKKAYEEAKKNGLIKEDISDDFRNKVKQWVSFPRTVAKKYPVFKGFYDRAERYFEDVDNYATTMGDTVKPYMDSANQETVNKLLIDARLNKQYAYSKEELQKAGHSEEVVKEYLSVVNTMNQGLHYMTNMLNRSGNDIEEIYNFVAKVKGMKNLLKPYKALENKDNINNALTKTIWGIKKSLATVKVFKKQELINMGLSEEEQYAYDRITKLMYKNSNYVPFKRYGDWFVAANDADGNLVEYSFHESQKEMRTEALAMVEKYPANKVTSGNVKRMATEAYQNMPVSILTMLKEFDEQLDTEFSKVYANIVGRGFPLHLIESKKIPGFEKDLSKSISDYILGISRWMATKEARHDFSKMFVEKDAKGNLLLDPKKQAQLYGYTDRYVNYVLGNSKEGSIFRQFMFRYYLGGLVKSAMLNFTQSLTTTLPTSAKYIEGSIIRRSRLMADAIKTAAISMDKLKITNPQLADALQKALKDGVISEQMVKMLRGEVYGKKLNKLDKILSYMFEFAEQSNRKIAFTMIYNEAITNGVKTKGRKGGYQVLSHEEAIKFAEDFVKETQFEYCVDTDTEILTTNGWKKYNETRKGDIVYGVDNNLNTIQTKIENIHIYAGNHEVIKFSNKHGFEMVLTPNHDCLVQNYNSGNKKWCKAIKRKAANINTGHHLVRIGLPYQSDIEEIYTDDFVKLLAWILAEGCYHKFHCQWYRKGVLIRKTPVKNNNIRLYQSIKHNPLYVEEIEQLLLNLGGHYKRFCKNQHQGNNLITWTIKKPLSSKILEIIPDKLITKELVNNLSVRQMGLFIETFSKGDGTLLERGGWLITQKAKINLDYIQMMNTLCGKTSNLYDLNQRTKCYSLYLAKNIRRTSCNECKKEKTVVDTIWCPETTSGNWIARRNGRVFVTGNSKLNKSELMRGWKAPLFTFRVFAGSYLSLLKSMMLEGEWKALSEALGIMLLLGGLVAFPGLKEIEKALELMGYDPKKGIKKKFGQWGDLSLHGILYPLGIDLSGALGTIEIVPGDIQQGIVPAVGGLILGVPMDIPKRMGRAWTLLTKNKDVYRAVEAIMPEAIRNPMVAVRWIKEGEAKSATYEPIAKVGGFDTALKFLGIQPATLSKAYEREHSESILRNLNYSEGYNWRIAKAIYKKDSDGFKDILEEIKKHNVKIGKLIAGGDKEAVRKYILPTRQGIQRNLLKMISPQASELKSMPKVLRPAYREIQEVMK